MPTCFLAFLSFIIGGSTFEQRVSAPATAYPQSGRPRSRSRGQVTSRRLGVSPTTHSRSVFFGGAKSLHALGLVKLYVLARASSKSKEGEHPHEREVRVVRSEEHTSELQSRLHLVCRLLLEKKKK